MTYDLSREIDRANFREYFDYLCRKGGIVELTEKKGFRTLNQNKYLHLILSYFALQYGERMEYIKQEFYKRIVNPDLFVRYKQDRIVGEVSYLRSSADLTTAEMSLSIDRFRDWSSLEAGIYIPSPDDNGPLGEIWRDLERNKRWVLPTEE